MGYPYPYFCLCAFSGPYKLQMLASGSWISCYGFSELKGLGFRGLGFSG